MCRIEGSSDAAGRCPRWARSAVTTHRSLGGIVMVRAQLFKIRLYSIAVGIGFLCSGIAGAHHSVAPYDRGSFQELEGVISGINWRNPHVRLTLSVTDDSGQTAEWQLEGDSANAAARKGFTRDSVRIGDRVKVGGWPSTLGRRSFSLSISWIRTVSRPSLPTSTIRCAGRVGRADRRLSQPMPSSGAASFVSGPRARSTEHGRRSPIPPWRRPRGPSGTR